jgi:hypothetical protein
MESWFKLVSQDDFSMQLARMLENALMILNDSQNQGDPFSSSAMLNGTPLDIALSPLIYLLYNLAQSSAEVCCFIKSRIFPESSKNIVGESFEILLTHPGQSRLRVVLEDLIFVLFDKNGNRFIYKKKLFEYYSCLVG